MKGMFAFGLAIGLFLGAAFGVVIYAMIAAAKQVNPGYVPDDREPLEIEEPDYYKGY